MTPQMQAVRVYALSIGLGPTIDQYTAALQQLPAKARLWNTYARAANALERDPRISSDPTARAKLAEIQQQLDAARADYENATTALYQLVQIAAQAGLLSPEEVLAVGEMEDPAGLGAQSSALVVFVVGIAALALGIILSILASPAVATFLGIGGATAAALAAASAALMGIGGFTAKLGAIGLGLTWANEFISGLTTHRPVYDTDRQLPDGAYSDEDGYIHNPDGTIIPPDSYEQSPGDRAVSTLTKGGLVLVGLAAAFLIFTNRRRAAAD